MKVDLETRHDAAYFAFADADAVRQEKLDGGRIVDYAADGTVVGIEFLEPSRGLDLDGLPRALEIARAARRRGLRVLPAPGIARAG